MLKSNSPRRHQANHTTKLPTKTTKNKPRLTPSQSLTISTPLASIPTASIITSNKISPNQPSSSRNATPLTVRKSPFFSSLKRKTKPTPYTLPLVCTDGSLDEVTALLGSLSSRKRALQSKVDTLSDPNTTHPVELNYTHPLPSNNDGVNRLWKDMSGFVPRINIDNDDDDVLINNLTGWMRRNGAYISEDVEVRGVNQTKEENGKDEDGHKEPKGGQERESGSIQGDGLHHNYEQNGQLEQGVLVSKSWGIFAKEKIPKHTIICAIPYPLMIQQTHPPERIKGFAGPQEDLGYEQFISQQEKRTQNKHTLKNKNDQNDQNGEQNNHHFKIPQNIFDNIAEFPHGSMVLLYLHLLNQKDSFFS